MDYYKLNYRISDYLNIRHCLIDQVTARLIRQLPDWNQAAAWSIRTPVCENSTRWYLFWPKSWSGKYQQAHKYNTKYLVSQKGTENTMFSPIIKYKHDTNLHQKVPEKGHTFALNWPHWVAMSVWMAGCLSVCLSVYAIGCSFFMPLIGAEITWSVPGLSLVLLPSLSVL